MGGGIRYDAWSPLTERFRALLTHLRMLEAMAKKNDAKINDPRERLAEVRQQDINESNLNEDFVTWLKTKGPTWLLIILAFIVAYLVMVRWQQQEARLRDEAWIDLMSTTEPASLEDVANRHEGVDAISDLARLMAADSLLQDLQRGRTLSEDGQVQTELDEETTASHQEYASRLYQAVASNDDGTTAKALMTVCALNGLAAIAECRGDLDAAADFYRQAADRATGHLEPLAAQANGRAASIDQLAGDISFATPPPPPVVPTLPINPQELPPGLTPLNPDTLPPAPPQDPVTPADP